MIEFLIKQFVADYQHPDDLKVREQYGKMSSIVGLLCNIFIFVTKLIGGLLTNSISVIGDAINNLTDMVSSLLLIIGFKLASKPADREHPFGHARSEYLISTVVASIILLVGIQLIIESVKKILHPEPIRFQWITIVILVISIAIKFWMSIFYRTIGKKIQSELLRATAVDSLSDCISTTAVIIALLLYYFFGWNLDGVIGIIVGLVIVKAGIELIRDTIDKILGTPVSKNYEEQINTFVQNYDKIHNTHDLIVHDYGPGHIFASIHVEVDAKEDTMEIHNIIDRIEREINRDMNLELTIHTDPIVLDDPQINATYDRIFRMVKEIDNDWDMHDFRMVHSDEYIFIIFDLEIPVEETRSYESIVDIIKQELKKINPSYAPKITVDRGLKREVQ